MEKIIWKDIPGYLGYLASNTGHIKNKSTDEVLNEFFYGSKESPYLGVSVNDGETNKSVLLHRLICLAFHGLPPDARHTDVNHKDGDKLNCREDNVEWATRPANIIHAYDNKLNLSSQHIDVLDLVSGKIKHFRSLKEFGEFFRLGVDYDKAILSPRNQPWLGKYEITLDLDYVPPKMRSSKSIDVKDYTTGVVHNNLSLNEVRKLLGLLKKTVRLRLNKKSLELTNGCVIKDSSDKRPWPAYSDKLVNISVLKYKSRAVQVKNALDNIDCYDYKTGTLLIRVNLNTLENDCGLSRPTVKRIIEKGIIKLVNGCVFKLHNDKRPFPEYEKEAVDKSIAEFNNRSSNNARLNK